jgi:hypothetical protein
LRDAEEMLGKSIAIWRDLSIRFFAGRDMLMLASLYHHSGESTKEDEALNTAMEMFTHVGAKMYAQKVLSMKELLKA